MPSINTGFTVRKAVWQYETSSMANSRSTRPTKIDELHLTCNDCGHPFVSDRDGPSAFTISAFRRFVKCPKCGQDNEIADSDLPRP